MRIILINARIHTGIIILDAKSLKIVDKFIAVPVCHIINHCIKNVSVHLQGRYSAL